MKTSGGVLAFILLTHGVIGSELPWNMTINLENGGELEISFPTFAGFFLERKRTLMEG